MMWTVAVVWALPFIGLVMASIRPSSELLHGWWVFREFTPTLGNYETVLFHTSIPMVRPLVNSFFVSIWGTLIPMVFGAMAGYAFARHTIPFKGLIVTLLLSLLAIPLQMVVVPLYRIMHTIRLLDSLWAVVILNTATAVPWITFFMMNTVKSQPYEIEESAKIDGASEMQVFGLISMPQSVPALLSVFTLQFVWCWVDFFLPLIFLYTPAKFVAVQVIPLLRGQFVANWGNLSAASVLVTLVPFAIFMALQKYYISGSVGWIADR
jgi:multiple sugar transport system permease protein